MHDHWKKLWCWEVLGAREEDDRGWDGWMASLTGWTWVWVNSGSWWWTGRPGVLQFIGSQSWTWLSNWTTNILGSFSSYLKETVVTLFLSFQIPNPRVKGLPWPNELWSWHKAWPGNMTLRSILLIIWTNSSSQERWRECGGRCWADIIKELHRRKLFDII